MAAQCLMIGESREEIKGHIWVRVQPGVTFLFWWIISKRRIRLVESTSLFIDYRTAK
jgi:hypothetical protein